MEIKNPECLSNEQLSTERVQIVREVARLTLYLDIVNTEIATRTPEDQEAQIIPIRG